MSSRKSLAYYSYDSLKNPWLSGGGALRDFEVLKRQTEAWKEIVIWTGAYPGFVAAKREGIQIRPLGFGNSYLVSRLSFTLLANFRLLFESADVIGNSISAYAPLLAGLFRRRRFFLVAHHYVGQHSKQKYSLAGSVAWFCEWLLFRFSRHLIVSNGKVAERVRSMNPHLRILQSQNGFDSRLLEEKPLVTDPPFILFLGRFDIYMKGLDLLIPAFLKLRKELSKPLKLVIAGAASGKTLTAVQGLIPEHENAIELIPNVSEEKKRELLRSCLFFCSPSRFEGWGIAALEANASGKPVLVSRADGFLDSIKEGFSGMMVPVEDGAALVEAMRKLCEDVALREELGSHAREWASQFTWNEIAERERLWLGGISG